MDEEVHEGIDFLGSSFNKEDRKVGIENTEQYKEEKSDEETVAVAVNIQISFPIRPPSNRLAVSRERVSAEGFRWPLAPILDGSSIDFLSFHFSISENSKPWKTVQVPLVLSHPPRKYGPETDVLTCVDAFSSYCFPIRSLTIKTIPSRGPNQRCQCLHTVVTHVVLDRLTPRFPIPTPSELDYLGVPIIATRRMVSSKKMHICQMLTRIYSSCL